MRRASAAGPPDPGGGPGAAEAEAVDERTLPRLSVLALWFSQLVQGVTVTLPYTIAVFMVRHYEEDAGRLVSGTADEQRISRMTGMLAGVFQAASVLTSFGLGRLSDVVGRKPVLLLGNIACSLCMLGFGLAPTYRAAIAARFVGGLFNGVIGALKTIIGEGCGPQAQARAMGYLSLAWGMGTILGPGIGGALADPCTRFSADFPLCGGGGIDSASIGSGNSTGSGSGDGGRSGMGGGSDGLFARRPYLLPCIVAAIFAALAAVATTVLLSETLPRKVEAREQRRMQRRVAAAAAARGKAAAAAGSSSGGGDGAVSAAPGQRPGWPPGALARWWPLGSSSSGSGGSSSGWGGRGGRGQRYDRVTVDEEECFGDVEELELAAVDPFSARAKAKLADVADDDDADDAGPHAASAFKKRGNKGWGPTQKLALRGCDSARSLRCGSPTTIAEDAPMSDMHGDVGCRGNGGGDGSGAIAAGALGAAAAVGAAAAAGAKGGQPRRAAHRPPLQGRDSASSICFAPPSSSSASSAGGRPSSPATTAADDGAPAAAADGKAAWVAEWLDTDDDDDAAADAARASKGGDIAVINIDDAGSDGDDENDDDEGARLLPHATPDSDGAGAAARPSGGGGGHHHGRRRRWYALPLVHLTLAGYGLIALLYSFLDEILPLFASAPRSEGGLGWTPDLLSMPLSFGGLVLVFFALGGYPLIQRALGPVTSARVGLVATLLPALLPPCASLLKGSFVGEQAVLFAATAAKSMAGCTAFTASMVLVNVAAPKPDMGAVNGLGQTIAAAVRAAGPALAGLCWGASLGLPFAGHQFVPFAAVGAAALLTQYLYIAVCRAAARR